MAGFKIRRSVRVGRAYPKQYTDNVDEKKNYHEDSDGIHPLCRNAVTIQTKRTTNTKEVNKRNYMYMYRRGSSNKPRPCKVTT